MQLFRLMILTVVVTSLSACASGGPADSDADLGGPHDAGHDATAPHDTDTADTTADVVADVAQEPVCGVCCAGEHTCIDDATVGVCANNGTAYNRQTCDSGKTCKNGACITPPVCQAGESHCTDSHDRQICRPDGSGWRTETCAQNKTCLQGQCVSGKPNGAQCSADGDCAGGKCRCSSSDNCSPAPTHPYCTTACTPGSCSDGQVCVSAQDFPAAGYDHCMPTCNVDCPLDGMACVAVPTRDTGDLTFVTACYPDYALPIGQECTSASGCVGGTCLQGYFDTGLCTTECTGNCPQGTACVQLQSGGAYQCTPLCGDGSQSGTGPCPLDPDGSRFDVTCKSRITYSGDGKRVCVKP